MIFRSRVTVQVQVEPHGDCVRGFAAARRGQVQLPCARRARNKIDFQRFDACVRWVRFRLARLGWDGDWFGFVFLLRVGCLSVGEAGEATAGVALVRDCDRLRPDAQSSA